MKDTQSTNRRTEWFRSQVYPNSLHAKYSTIVCHYTVLNLVPRPSCSLNARNLVLRDVGAAQVFDSIELSIAGNLQYKTESHSFGRGSVSSLYIQSEEVCIILDVVGEGGHSHSQGDYKQDELRCASLEKLRASSRNDYWMYAGRSVICKYLDQQTRKTGLVPELTSTG